MSQPDEIDIAVWTEQAKPFVDDLMEIVNKHMHEVPLGPMVFSNGSLPRLISGSPCAGPRGQQGIPDLGSLACRRRIRRSQRAACGWRFQQDVRDIAIGRPALAGDL